MISSIKISRLVDGIQIWKNLGTLFNSVQYYNKNMIPVIGYIFIITLLIVWILVSIGFILYLAS